MNSLRFTNLGYRKTIIGKRYINDFDNELYVSPLGNDSNIGDETHPLLTLQQAITNAELLSGSILIKLSKGDYYISSTLVINKKITIIGNNSILKGSELATFTDTNDSSIIKSNKTYNKVYQIFVNNKKIFAASTTRINLCEEYKGLYISVINSITDTDGITSQEIGISSSDVSILTNNDEYKNVWITIMHNWASSKVKIKSIDAINNKLIFRTYQNPSGDGNLYASSNDAIIFENLRNGLSLNSYKNTFTEGTYYQDGDGYIYYHLKEGENVNNLKIEIPVLDTFFNINSGVNIFNLKFTQTNYNFLDSDYACSDTQSAYSIPGSIKVYSSNCVINRCEFYNIAQNCIEFLNGSSRCRVDNCYFHNIGCGAVKIGELDSTISTVPDLIIVNNCVLEYIGELLQQSAGLIMTFAENCSFIHNDVSKTFYTGITSGHIWGKQTANTAFKNCYIGYNNVHHISCYSMSDLGAIYNLGATQGLIVEYNLIHDIIAQKDSGSGLYLDEGTKESIWRYNIVYNVVIGIMFHWTNNNSVYNNIIFDTKTHGYLLLNSITDSLTKNIIENSEIINSIEDNSSDYTISDNIYWNTNKTLNTIDYDSNYFINDPYFVDESNYDFNIIDETNINKINFTNFVLNTNFGVLGKRMQNILEYNNDFYEKYNNFIIDFYN